MDRLEAITILLAAVDNGSLSAASRQLRIPLATVSRRVSELEDHLKMRLLLRGNRKLALTEAGRTYVASCRRIMDDLAEAERTAAGEYHAPQGELTISVPLVMGRAHALPVIVDFLHAYPDIRIRVQFVNRNVSLLEEQVDVAMRVGELPDSSMIGTRVGLIRQVLCASPAYLKVRGTPNCPADLMVHDCVGYEHFTAGMNWEFRHEAGFETIPIRWRLVVNSIEAAVIAAAAGAGIARVLSCQIDEQVKSKTLVTVLSKYELPPIPVSLIYPSQRQVPLKLRAFLDFSIPRLRERLGARGQSE
ncbi:LysR family transcriptional regulator [Paraburkholderia sp. BL21I4N1]|uniref:LysR family transcriptional regulator n=1 Tax=Paraburkholderia sp. BL21I4N1 TaxID=1938801 RepID=UPI000CFA8301|nr:LysR family transcriptional regulator [Paraburkholderia sp. BL21I4N1]PQV46048.1 LysR family transcriptional regulator [Paraburkholderia sp. BL21I4N1]